MPFFCHRRRRWTGYDGLFFDEFAPDSAWIREQAVVRLPKLPEAASFVIHGEFRPHPDAKGIETGPLGAVFSLNHHRVASFASFQPGPFSVRFTATGRQAGRGGALRMRLRGVGFTNFLAWLGRVAAHGPIAARLQRFRQQNKNRQQNAGVPDHQSKADGARVHDLGSSLRQ